MGALAPGQIARRDGALIDYLEPLLRQRGATLDHAQSAALDRLQSLCDELAAFKVARQSTLKRLLSPPDVPRGVYLYGGVGRGKSFLMDSFYAVVPLRRKTRVHFHAFMRDVHEELKTLTREVDPLATVAQRIARRFRLVCFDEFHVSDIADAMILGRLLTALFSAGVVFVMTSNYPPDDLYPAASSARTSCPRSSSCTQWLDVIEVDWRRRLPPAHAGARGDFPRPAGAVADAAMERTFDAMRNGPDESPQLTIEGRPLAREAARAARSGSTSTRCATARARSAITSSSRNASRCCSCPTSRS
jgi:cell division protein ZapE